MKWFVSSIEGAGLIKFGARAIFLAMLGAATLVGFLTASSIGIPAFGLFMALGALAFEFEALTSLAKARRRKLARLWPEVIDSVYSATVSGMSLHEAMDDLAIAGPNQLRNYFQDLTKAVDTGKTMEQAVDSLKASIGEVHADKFCEVIRLANESGSESLAYSLRQQAQNLRSDLSLAGQLEAKQNWVVGAAKLAIAAPWVVVALLSVRSENSTVYNSSVGITVLMAGFLVSMVAYRFIHVLGNLPSQPRVFLT